MEKVTHVQISAMCPRCASFVGNDIAGDGVALDFHDDKGHVHGYAIRCDNCGAVLAIPYKLIDAEVERIKALK